MAHHCHATKCEREVPPEMFMCRRHWFMLPKPIRDRIWAMYRAGQCDDWCVTHEYCEAAKKAIIFIAAIEGIAADVKLYDVLDPTKRVQP